MEDEGGKMKGLAEKMNEKFESLETQKKSLRKSIYSVFFEWKGFEEQIVSTQNCFKDGLSELESKEKDLCSVQDSLSQIGKELDSERDSLKKKLQQVEEKEKEFKLFYDTGIQKLNKERDDFRKEVEFREANFREREKTLEDLLKKEETQRDEIEEKQENIKKSEDFLKEIELSMKEMERRRMEIEAKEEEVMKREKKVEAKEKVFKVIKDLNENRSKELDIREKELDGKEKRLEMSIQKVEKQTDNVLEIYDYIVKHSKEPPLQKCKELNASVEEVAVEESERGFREAQMNQLNDEHHASVKEAAAEEPKEKRLHKRIYEENCNENQLKKKGKHLEKELSVKEGTVGKGIHEEGYDLYKFLQDHEKELNKVVDQVIKTIQQSKEPAKLVLSAIEEFYNRVITEKETEEKKDIAFKSCILLSDQLMKLSVDSRVSSVKGEALKFAKVWEMNMKIRDSFEVLGFLYLLASYRLADAFPTDAIIRMLEVVARHQETPDLCRRLCLKNSIHVIRELIRKNRFLLAFDYVHELELVDEFPPVALLKRHVNYSSMEAKKTVNRGKKGNGNPEAEDRALSIEISALKDVIRCIMRRNLQAEYPSEELKERIDSLERQRESWKASSPENQKTRISPP